jgi:hypothetical protein
MAGERRSRFSAIWKQHDNGASLSALINGELGWWMLLRFEGDAGLSSRNPDYDGPDEAMIEYRLDNGQHDLYPASWALPTKTVLRAVEHFRQTGRPAPFVTWHDDDT